MSNLIKKLEAKLAQAQARAGILRQTRYRSTREEKELQKLEESIRNIRTKIEAEKTQPRLFGEEKP